MTQISVAGILQSKAPRLARRIPSWVVRWLSRTIHQEELNHILATYDKGDPLEFLRGFFSYIGVTYETVGLDELPDGERYIFASNHPFGGMDGMMLAERIGTRFGDVRVIVNDLLMYLDPLAGIFVPVNKHGAQRGAYAVAFSEAFSGDLPVLTFPAGLCSRRVASGQGASGCGASGRGASECGASGRGALTPEQCDVNDSGSVVSVPSGRRGERAVMDLEWRPNFVKRAAQTGRLIVPVYVEGRLSKRFYRLSEWRKRLGIKANIEMLLLPDEMFRQRGQHFRLIFGKPVSVEQLRAAVGESYVAMAHEVKRMSYALAPGI